MDADVSHHDRQGVRGTNAEAFIERVNLLYGDEDWKRIQAALWRRNITPPEYRSEMVNLMRIKLKYELGYKYSQRLPMQMHNKVTIFDMVFASDHDAGDDGVGAGIGQAGNLRRQRTGQPISRQ